MFQIRIHGRGGQGVVSGAEMLSVAAFLEGRYDVVVLDELTYCFKYGWLDLDEVLDVLRRRPEGQHVVITGRDAAPALVAAADLVTEMGKVKHPMDVGQKGQRGIEW